jgi:ferredoxin
VILCPEVFDDDDEGFGVVRNEDVPKEAEGDCQRAEASCPERAIQITR